MSYSSSALLWVPVAIFLVWNELVTRLVLRFGERLVNLYMFTGEVAMWHVAAVVNAAIAYGLMAVRSSRTEADSTREGTP